MPGELLVHAQQHVALEVNIKQEASLAINHALVAILTPKTVLVSKENKQLICQEYILS